MNTNPANKAMTLDHSILQAKDFISQYYSDTVNHKKPAKEQAQREKEVTQQLRYQRGL
mgnify:CR=1 FL=1